MVRVAGFEPTASWSRISVGNSMRLFRLRLLLFSPNLGTVVFSPPHCFRLLISYCGSACGSRLICNTFYRVDTPELHSLFRRNFRTIFIKNDRHSSGLLQFVQLLLAKGKLMNRFCCLSYVYLLYSATSMNIATVHFQYCSGSRKSEVWFEKRSKFAPQ